MRLHDLDNIHTRTHTRILLPAGGGGRLVSSSRWRCFRFLFLLSSTTTKLHLQPILVLLLLHCAHCTNQRVIYTHSWNIAFLPHPFIWYPIIPTHLYPPKRFHQARITPWRRTTPVIPKTGPTQLLSPRPSMWLVCTLEWVARLARAASELSMKVLPIALECSGEWESQLVCVCMYHPGYLLSCRETWIGTNLLNNQQVAIKFEPRKSDAPQLRDEYRTYKILSGLSMWWCIQGVIVVHFDWHLFLLFSRYSCSLLFWSRRTPQHLGHWHVGPKSGRFIRYVQSSLQYKNSGYACQADGMGSKQGIPYLSSDTDLIRGLM